MSDPSADGSRRAWGWALAISATLTMSVSYFDRQTLSALAPAVTSELHISESEYGWLVSAFSIAYLVGSPAAGVIIDRVGARRGLLGAVLAWSAVAALHSTAPGFGVLFTLRIALGLAEAPSFPGSAQTVHRALAPEDRPRGFGVLFTGSSIGAMLAPPLAIFLETRWGWRVAFLSSAAVGLAWVPLWLLVAFRKESRALLDDADSIVRSPAPGPYRTGRSSARVPTSMWELVCHPAVLRAITVVVASAPMIAFVLNWNAKYLVRDHHLTLADCSRYLWFPPLVFDAGSILFGHFASRRAARTSAAGGAERGLLALAAALAMTGALIPFAGGPWPATLLAGVTLAGGGGLFALLTADLLARVPPATVSTAGGICASAQSFAYVVVAPLIGYAVGRFGRYTEVLVALGLWIIPGTTIWLLWKPPPMWRAKQS